MYPHESQVAVPSSSSVAISNCWSLGHQARYELRIKPFCCCRYPVPVPLGAPEHGNANMPPWNNQKGMPLDEDGTFDVDHICRAHDSDNITISPRGTSQSYAFRRLRKERPDLLERVIAGELKPGAAMEQAGFRKLIRSVRMDAHRRTGDREIDITNGNAKSIPAQLSSKIRH